MAKLRRKVKRRIGFILFLVVILVGFILLKGVFNNPSSSLEEPKPNNPKEEEIIKTYTASLIATGDALLHAPIYNAAYDKDSNSYDFSNMLTFTKDILKGYDIKYYNQETVSDDSKEYKSYPRFNTPTDWNEDMIDIGFNLVSLATNHSMDYGVSSAKASADWWYNQKDVLATGMASSSEKSNEHKIMEVNGITYTMLSYTYGTNGLGGSDILKEPYLVNLFDEEKVKADIAAVRDKVDVLIVAMHWGDEYKQVASETQKKQARFLADNGVDIILGNHSHCIEPWEWIDDTVVFYSFGNFISNQMGAESAEVRRVGVIGMFGTLKITKTLNTQTQEKEIKISDIGADLNYTYKYYNNAKGKYDYLVIPFSKMESKYLSNYESVYNDFSSVLKKYDDNINIVPLPTT